MERLPIEILHSVFIELPLRQRLECTLVCRQWSNLLRQRSLFYSVTMEDEDICESFLEMIQRFPARAHQVEILRLDNCPCTTFDKRKFCNIFPKARIIEITSDRSHGGFIHFAQRPVELTVPKTQITRLADYSEGELAYELMATGRCSRLTYLNLGLTPSYDSTLHYFSSLKNLPVLNELHMDLLHMTLNDMEIIHNNVPSIKVFQLEWLTLEPCTLPNNIKPAAVTKFHLDARGFNERMDIQLLWLDYIRQKYPDLTELSFWCNENEAHDTTNLLDFYRLGVLPIAKALGSQLTMAPKLSIPDELDIFSQFDEYGCRLRECTILVEDREAVLNKMAQSTQTEHIQLLRVLYSNDSTFQWLPNLKKLKELELISGYVPLEDYEEDQSLITTFSLNGLLEQCPDSLESLTIFNAELLFPFPNDTHVFSSVKSLKLQNVVLPKGADRFLALYFPKLTSLRLIECLFSNATLSLPNHHLLHLEIITRNKSHAPIDFSLKTEKYAQPRLYPVIPQKFFISLYKGDDLYINPTQSQLASLQDDIRSRVFLELKVASVKSLLVNRLYYSTS